MRYADLLGIALSLALGACATHEDAVSAGTPSAPARPAPATEPQKSGAASAPDRPGAAGATGATGGAVLPAELSQESLRAFDAALDALQEGHADVAERGLLALARTNPELGGPHANLGIIYRHAGKLTQAVAELELAVRSNPQQPVYLNQLGIAYREQGQFARAREAYEKALAIDPAYPAPNLNLGVLFDLYLDDSKRAAEHYDRYLALTPGGDEKVGKWLADLKNRSRERGADSRKEKQ
jgi:Flp pilus assembly protein TadD